MDRIHPHRGLIVFAIVIAACGESRTVDSQGELSAPAIGRGTRADPPPDIPPPSSGGSSGGGAPGPGCPSRRPSDPSVAPLTEADVLAATGVYRPCTELEGLEIRYDEATGKLHWYRLDDRFVRIQSWEGTIEVVTCEEAACTVTWTDRGLGPRAHDLYLWRDPIAFQLVGNGALQEWVRIAD